VTDFYYAEPAIRERFEFWVREGTVMSGRRSLIKGFLEALRLIVGAVMSSAYRCGAMAPAGPDVVR
jgi:predicted metal-dependent HD superfamily phosphohydrolase